MASIVTLLDQRRRERDELIRTERYGPPPENPFKQLRVAKGLSLGDLTQYSKIDQRALSRLEAGLYTNPLPGLVQYWVARGAATEGQLLTDYEDFQYAQRKRHAWYFGPELIVDLACDIHPFRQLRSRRPSLFNGEPLPVGLIECCEALCLPLDSIQFFEKKFRMQKSVPKNLLNALNVAGYTRQQLQNFESGYVQWRENAKQVVFS